VLGLSNVALRFIDPMTALTEGSGPLVERPVRADVFTGKTTRAPSLLEAIAALPTETQTGIRALLAKLEAHHFPSYAHCVRVGNLSMRLAHDVGLDAQSVARIGIAGLVHDVGKIAVPVALLDGKGRLTPEERSVIQGHAAESARLLGSVPLPGALSEIRAAAADHHERLDGRGYPAGKRAEQLSLGARIVAVADVYDALTDASRRYQVALTPEAALARISLLAPRELDSDVVRALRRAKSP
jgi:HD-GYP domain-containing protein (c-di-GMP phosphodiesterase class II)